MGLPIPIEGIQRLVIPQYWAPARASIPILLFYPHLGVQKISFGPDFRFKLNFSQTWYLSPRIDSCLGLSL